MNDPDHWNLLKDIFAEAVSLPPDQRASFLDQACADRPDLRAEVDELILSDDRPSDLFEQGVFHALGTLFEHEDDRKPGLRIGSYEILHEIGRGGMAVVYAAVRADRQYRQRVAIKLIKRGMDTDAIIGRFRRERQILADLEHPNIARLYDGGVTADGLPYLVMEHIEGDSIEVYCEQQSVPLETRLSLFQEVCGAVHFAHQNLVVHRDLKPSNILVTADGLPKLLDFGIAKLLAGPESGAVTADDLRPMTPEFASPEQLAGKPLTTASDVYSLGVLLYILLTGHRPYRLGAGHPMAVEKAILDQEPDKPSVVQTPGGVDRRALRGDLDNIVAKAMAKHPERRYASAAELAEDVRRFLTGQPVVARSGSSGYQVRKFIRRHWLAVTAAVLILLSLLAGVVATSRQAQVAERQRQSAQLAASFMVDLFEVTHPDRARGERVTARQVLDRADTLLAERLDGEPEIRALLLDAVGEAFLKLGLYGDAAHRLEQALALRENELRAEDEALSKTLHNLAEARFGQGDFAGAESLHRRALESRRRAFGAEHEQMAESENAVAKAVQAQGRLDDAETILRRSLAWQQRALGPAHERTATTLNNLALTLKEKARFEEALSLYRQALDMNRGVFGEYHSEVAINLNNLAETHRAEGDCRAALPYYQEALEVSRKLYLEAHPDVALYQNNLAGCFKDLGDFSAAERLYEDSLAIRREVLGPQHPETAQSLINLGTLEVARRDPAAAAPYLEQALKILRPRGASGDLAIALSNLAIIRHRLGERDAAEALLREALEVKKTWRGDLHVEVAKAHRRLAVVLGQKQDFPGAERHHRLALEIFAAHRDERAEAEASHELAKILIAQERQAAAQPLLRTALAYWLGQEGEEAAVKVLRLQERLDESVRP